MKAIVDMTALFSLLPQEVLAAALSDGMRSALYSEKEAARYLKMDANKFRGLGLPVTKMHESQQRVWSRATLDKEIARRTAK
jgi:hypothetical protein